MSEVKQWPIYTKMTTYIFIMEHQSVIFITNIFILLMVGISAGCKMVGFMTEVEDRLFFLLEQPEGLLNLPEPQRHLAHLEPQDLLSLQERAGHQNQVGLHFGLTSQIKIILGNNVRRRQMNSHDTV